MQASDQLNIETPEQVALELPLAGIGSRFLALAVDSLLQMGAFMALLIGLSLLGSAFSPFPFLVASLSSPLGGVLMILVPFCIYWGYFAFFEILWHGQSPGKRVAGIRVIQQTGRPMTVIEAIGRNLMRGIDILPGIYAIGLVCMMLNRQNRRLGDFVAGTIVVHDRGIETVDPVWAPGSPATATPELRQLAGEELVLIETYLSRRYDLDMKVRENTAKQIVALVRQKAGVEKPAHQSDDDFLEALARQLRDTAALLHRGPKQPT